ncbi:hypothetical protein HYFRA_00011952 [Hymenoscyphus fraxineus]|uniref:Cytochrome P450 n=1 Tax=Hymenoscyphus fraxineus TaxID=746836 RepID=A0A9N9L0Y9_9HELO|nr:hypothetical protein HYFRA_00011952 [Hymenoscyphus fraxineus]
MERFLLTALALLLAVFFYNPDNLNSFWIARQFPLVGKELGNRKQRVKAFLSPAGYDLFRRGYEQFKNGVFRVTTDEGELVVLPNSALDELRTLGDDHITRYEPMDIKTQGNHTGLHAADDGLAFLIRNEINRKLPMVTDMMHPEAVTAVPSTLGRLPDWTPVIPARSLMGIVAVVIGRVLVGADLCRDRVYIEHTNLFSRTLFTCARQLVQLPRYFRYLARYFMPEFWQLRTSRRRVSEFLRPVIAERQRALRLGLDVPEDNITWTLRRLGNDVKDTVDAITHEQFGLSVSANSVTMLTAIACLYELAVEPEVVEDLRREIIAAKARHGDKLNSKALFEMKLLDSVMRESMRLSPTNATRWMRRANRPVKLSDGTVIPTGTVFRVLASPPLFDADIYPDPFKFDAYRFVRLREGSVKDPIGYNNREMYQFVSAAKENLQWGLDRHACPGRFFAAVVIKLILAEVIEHYDIRMPGGAKDKCPYVLRGEFRGVDYAQPLEFRSVLK